MLVPIRVRFELNSVKGLRPINEGAHILASIAGRRALSHETLRLAAKLGHVVEIEDGGRVRRYGEHQVAEPVTSSGSIPPISSGPSHSVSSGSISSRAPRPAITYHPAISRFLALVKR